MNALTQTFQGSSLSSKLAAAFAAVLLLAVVLGGVGIYAIATLDDEIQSMYTKELQGVSNARAVQFRYATMGRQLRQALLTGDDEVRARALRELDHAGESDRVPPGRLAHSRRPSTTTMRSSSAASATPIERR